MQTTIQIRVDQKIKDQAAKTLEAMGIDLSAGIKLFLGNVVATQSLAFTPMTKQGIKIRNWEQLKKEIDFAEKHGKKYKNAEELHKDLLARKGF